MKIYLALHSLFLSIYESLEVLDTIKYKRYNKEPDKKKVIQKGLCFENNFFFVTLSQFQCD